MIQQLLLLCTHPLLPTHPLVPSIFVKESETSETIDELRDSLSLSDCLIVNINIDRSPKKIETQGLGEPFPPAPFLLTHF